MTQRTGGPLRRFYIDVDGDTAIVTARRWPLSAKLPILLVFVAFNGLLLLPAVFAGDELARFYFGVELLILVPVAVRNAIRAYRGDGRRRIPLGPGLRTEIVESEVRNARSVFTTRSLYALVDGHRHLVVQVKGSSPDFERLPDVARWLEATAQP